MRQIIFFLIAISLLPTATLSAQNAKTKKLKCRPSCLVISSDIGEGGITYHWIYDDHGRLIRDSITGYQNAEMNSIAEEKFEYRGDSVFHFHRGGDTSVTIFDKSGMPLIETLPYGVRYQLYYAASGKLEKMETTQRHINKYGDLDIIATVCDSIAYESGNIISYRLHYPHGIYPACVVSCSYYSYTAADTDFYPVGKITGMSQNPMTQFGGLKVNLFSKNMVKRMESSYGSLEFVFHFDQYERVSAFDRIFSSASEGGYTSTDHSAIKYKCD